MDAKWNCRQNSPEIITIIQQEEDRFAVELPPALIHRIRGDFAQQKISADQWLFYAAASGNIIHQINLEQLDPLEWLILGRDKNAAFNMARYNELIAATENLNLLIHRYTEGLRFNGPMRKRKSLIILPKHLQN